MSSDNRDYISKSDSSRTLNQAINLGKAQPLQVLETIKGRPNIYANTYYTH